jgi:hypothetical protein
MHDVGGGGGKAFSLGAIVTGAMLVDNKPSSDSEPLSDAKGLLAFRSSIRALIISFEMRCLTRPFILPPLAVPRLSSERLPGSPVTLLATDD